MDYGKRSYGSPANNHPTFIQEITDQYIQSIGGIWPADFKRPYVYSSFQEMQYLFNSPVVYTGGEAPLLEDLDVELDPLIPVPSDPYDPVIPPVWPTPTPPPIPDDDDDDEEDCICSGAYIQYTTLQMQKNEEQTLVVRGDRNCLYTWAITSGGGSFEYYTTDNKHAIGAEVTYIAPSSNASCSDNPTITLYCNGAFANSITIAVNAVTGTETAFFDVTDRGCRIQDATYLVCSVYINRYYCSGALDPNTFFSVNCYVARVSEISSGCAYCYTRPATTACGMGGRSLNEILALQGDWRNPTMIANGCCPYQLL
jgi:hypothetical protein